MKRPEIILLDVYDTLLDMTELAKKVNALMNNKIGYSLWMEMFMEYCFVDNCIVQFNDFLSIGRITMMMAAQRLGATADEQDILVTLDLLKHLPLHDDVEDNLSDLNDKNFRIAALTNSSEKVVTERMERTGLISYFEAVLSAEHVKKYKPALEVYSWAAKKLDVPADDILLISAHSWDIAGAANAGMKTAYVKRSKDMSYSLAPEADISARSLTEIVKQLLELGKGTDSSWN